jgi:putative phosphoesterase
MFANRSSAANRSAQLHHSETVQLPSTGELRVVLISDTHSHAHKDSVKHVRDQKPDLLLHGGDIGDLSVLKPFAEIAPLHVVRGNIDSRGPSLFDSIDLSFERDGQSVLRVLLTHIAVYGPKLRADTRRLATQYGCKLVACGHSHVPFIGHDRGISIINPGSIGPRRFVLPIVFGVLDIKPTGLAARHINCETGEVWLP